MSDCCYTQHVFEYSLIRCTCCTELFGCYMAGATWNCCRIGACFVYTIQPCTSFQCHLFKAKYVWYMCAYLWKNLGLGHLNSITDRSLELYSLLLVQKKEERTSGWHLENKNYEQSHVSNYTYAKYTWMTSGKKKEK